MAKPRNPRTKLSDADIHRIVELYSSQQYSQGKLSQIFGVAASYIGMIVRGEVRQSVNRRAVLEDRSLQPLEPTSFEKNSVHDLLAKGYSISEVNSAMSIFNAKPLPDLDLEPELEPELGPEFESFDLPHIAKRNLSLKPRDIPPDEIEILEQEIDDGLEALELHADEIAAMADDFERGETKKLEERIKVSGKSRKGSKPRKPKTSANLYTLDELNEMEPGNRYIHAAMGDSDLEAATREVFSTLPRDVWDSPLPEILIEKTLKGER